MPRVSQDHLDARRRQILDAARRCFLADGFHATSMQDILREADLSAGAVYRYFGGKEEIVAAIAGDTLGEVLRAYEDARGEDEMPTLHDFLSRAAATLQQLDEELGLARLAVQVWGEGLRSPALGRRATEIHGTIAGLLVPVVEAEQRRGALSDDVPADRIARLLTSLLPGFIFQRAYAVGADAKAFSAALAAVLAREPVARRS